MWKLLCIGVVAVEAVALGASPLTLGIEALGGAAGTMAGVILVNELNDVLSDALDFGEWRGPLMLGLVTGGITAGASLGVMGVASLLGEEGNPPACVSGAFLGGLVALFTEPVLYELGGFEVDDPRVEALGMTALLLAPAIGATAGFNWGTSDP